MSYKHQNQINQTTHIALSLKKKRERNEANIIFLFSMLFNLMAFCTLYNIHSVPYTNCLAAETTMRNEESKYK